MRVDPGSGLLEGVRQIESPNCDARPGDEMPSLIVVHGISLPPGEYGGPWIDALFTNTLDPLVHPYFVTLKGVRVSAHLLIRRDGEVVQYVPFHRRAWHAGVSCFEGRGQCNDFSIGIELEGEDKTPYTAEQYEVLAEAIRALCGAYPSLSYARITGHCDIAPGRKSDPGPAFDWERLNKALLI